MGIITDVFLPLALAFIMFALGLGLTGNDFLRVAKQPRDFFVGALSQIIILPIVAFVLIKIWPISPELAVGVMIIAAAPGGATSNILTSFAKGDVALSISLTAIISLLCVITIPFIVLTSSNLLLDNNMTQELSLTNIATKMFLIVTVPVVIGMLFRKLISKAAISFEPMAKKISTTLFVLVLIGAIVSERDNIISYFSQAGLITLILNVVMMVVAPESSQWMANILLWGVVANMIIMAKEILMPHDTTDTKKAIKLMTKGYYSKYFWAGIVIGSLIPIVVLNAFPSMLLIAGGLVLVGNYLTEFVRIRVPQMIPLS